MCLDFTSAKVVLVSSDRGGHFPRLPTLPADAASAGGGFVAVARGISAEESSLMVSDLVGEPLGENDRDQSPYDVFDDNDVEVEDVVEAAESPMEGNHFEGDISGVYLTSIDHFKYNGEAIFNRLVCKRRLALLLDDHYLQPMIWTRCCATRW